MGGGGTVSTERQGKGEGNRERESRGEGERCEERNRERERRGEEEGDRTIVGRSQQLLMMSMSPLRREENHCNVSRLRLFPILVCQVIVGYSAPTTGPVQACVRTR